MNTTSFYAKQIKKRYPDLEIEAIVLNQEGQYNDVLVINNALVFRFAKVPVAAKTLRQEVVILQNLQDRISLTIPNPIYYSIEKDVVGEAFMGYKMIPGKPFWIDDFQTISDLEVHNGIAVQLSGFLYELHHIPVHQVIPIELPWVDTRKDWASMYERIQAKLYAYMRPDARQQVSKHFETFLDNPDLYKFEPVLRHGDFGASNILYDPCKLSVVGIIDFGGTGLGDPAIDFAGLLISYGEKLYEQCYAVYPEMEQALKRARFYCGTFALQEALFGIENGDQTALQNGIVEYV
jgi:aminoglycoside 2''-phosphotransferase